MGTCCSQDTNRRPKGPNDKTDNSRYIRYIIAKKALKYYKEKIMPALEEELANELDRTFVSKDS